MAEFSPAVDDIVAAHFIVSDDVERSRRFYTEVLGGTVAFSGEVTYVALANTFVIINVGGGPTDDKPTVILETPSDPDRVSSFLNLRVKDIRAVYEEWSARGAQFQRRQSSTSTDPMLHTRSRRLSDRSRANHRPGRGLVVLVVASGILTAKNRAAPSRRTTRGAAHPILRTRSADAVSKRETQSRSR